MIFLQTQPKVKIENYKELLKLVCSLSKLFSDSEVPYLYYRSAENIFCKAFNTKNLARGDSAFDAQLGSLGIGLKTFVSQNGNKIEKVAEFNKLSTELNKLSDSDLAHKLAEYRNARIELANRTYGIVNSVYHCVARTNGSLKIFEVDYPKIDVNKIIKIKSSKTGISFFSGKDEYSFNNSKSTLFKRFTTPPNALEIKIDVLNDPYQTLLNLLGKKSSLLKPITQDYVILPLYSEDRKTKVKYVSEKDGLNKWNSAGRPRNIGEVKVRVPAYIHKQFPSFFPAQGVHFKLEVPTGEVFTAAVVEVGRKGLQTNPNKALAKWLLRDLLKLKEGELATYERLAILGFDSVRITKIREGFYKIDVADSTDNTSDEEFNG